MLKQISFSLLMFFITGCQFILLPSINNTQNNKPDTCESKPPSLLSSEVKTIQLSHTTKQENIKINKYQSIGYTFTANKNQIITYQLSSSDKICFWLVTPDNQIVTTNELIVQNQGQYLLQIYGLKKKKIDLEIGFKLPSSVIFIKNHYQKLSQGRYEQTWNNLSYRFQTDVAKGYNNYLDWWEGEVAEIRVGEVNLVEQTETTAIVDIELTYIKKSGRKVNDKKTYIYLVWNNSKNQWEINKKTDEI